MIVFGSSLHAYTQVPSTMDTAREQLRAGAATSGTVITTQTQSAGRGRQGKQWHSAVGNLHLTAIAAPVEPAIRWQISLITALAVTQCIQNIAPERAINIRFPNDIYCNQKKCGGILVEFEGDTPLIGIGINLIPVPPKIENIATHLADLSLLSVQESLFTSLTQVWHIWHTKHTKHTSQQYPDGFATLLLEWHANLGNYERLFTLPSGEQLLARVAKVTPEGLVTLEEATGAIRTIHIAALSLGI
jgi:BirA family transcriptional regulator, biotin operon repressor / biotin---[acetyl-CoA-carboxylase] ligase